MTATDQRMTAIEAFYRSHHTTLEKKVANRVSGASRALIEDACQFAWTRLLSRADIDLDQRGLAWMTVVATREAWQIANAADIPTGAYALTDDRGIIAEPVPHPGPTLDTQMIERELHDQRVRDFARLKPPERQALALKALGYSYTEIGELTVATYTAVNRRLSEGRAALRRLQIESARSREHRGGEDHRFGAYTGA